MWKNRFFSLVRDDVTGTSTTASSPSPTPAASAPSAVSADIMSLAGVSSTPSSSGNNDGVLSDAQLLETQHADTFESTTNNTQTNTQATQTTQTPAQQTTQQQPATQTSTQTQTPGTATQSQNGDGRSTQDPTQPQPSVEDVLRQQLNEMARLLAGGGTGLQPPGVHGQTQEPPPTAPKIPAGFKQIFYNGQLMLAPENAIPQGAMEVIPATTQTQQTQNQNQTQVNQVWPPKQDTKPVIPDLSIENFLSNEELDQVIDKPELLNTAFKRGMQTLVKHFQENFQMPDFTSITSQIDQRINQAVMLSQAVTGFFESNKDLIPHSDYTRLVMSQIERENPSKTYREIFELTAQESRRRLGLQMPVAATTTTTTTQNADPTQSGNNPPPAFAGQRRATTRPATTSQQQVDDPQGLRSTLGF